jgi:hypothetical protein
LQIYLDQLTRAEHVKSYKQAGDDANILDIAEEGMEDYLKQLNQDKTRSERSFEVLV